MKILFKLLVLPVTGPLCGTLWIAEQVRDVAVAEATSPAVLRRRLVSLERALEAGEMDEASFEVQEAIILEQLRELSFDTLGRG